MAFCVLEREPSACWSAAATSSERIWSANAQPTAERSEPERSGDSRRQTASRRLPGGRSEAQANIASKNLVYLRGKWRIEQQIRGRTIRSAIAGFWHIMPGRNSPQAALGHDSTHTSRCAGESFIGELREDAALAIASPVSTENALNVPAHLLVRELGNGGRSRMVESAARSCENIADAADARAAYGSRSCAAALRLLRFEPPVVEEVAAQAEFLRELSDGLPAHHQRYSLRFELGRLLFAFFCFHSWSFFSGFRSKNLAHLSHPRSEVEVPMLSRKLQHLQSL